MIENVQKLIGKRIHFVGIGGAGMSGIARIMMAEGLRVSGSDMKRTSITDSLESLGAEVFIGHDAKNIEGADLVIASGAIGYSNVEITAAHNAGMEILTRAEALATLMSGKKSVAIAGTHGKTTTTSMLTVALQSAGGDPSFAIGGLINSSGLNAHLGSGEIFVAEADESDGSFTAYHPYGAIITNIELDHVDHFKSLDEVFKAFLDFIDSIQSGGFLVVCIDDPGVKTLLSRMKRSDIKVITYGQGAADYTISRILLQPGDCLARVSMNGKILSDLHLEIPGQHNLMNATAALAAGVALGVNPESLIAGLARYSGSRRRFEHKGVVNGIEVIDDYGHHPTELRVTLETAKNYAEAGKVIVVFQPHRYSRTQAFAPEFADALSIADNVLVLEIYPASEEPIPGVTSQMITKHMDQKHSEFEPSMVKAVERVVSMAKPGDVIMTLGAGDVSSLAPVIVEALAEKHS
jgi:UDP-N-acetylmuramate--alanine ligase